MSNFSITAEQRRWLLEHDPEFGPYPPLDFDIKPHGCEKGAKYILSWAREQRIALEDGSLHVIPRHPVWWITVTTVQRHRKGFWRVKFDVTDLRDPTLWLKPCGGYQASAMGAVDSRPVVVDDDVRARLKEDAEYLRQLCEETQRARSRARRQRAA